MNGPSVTKWRIVLLISVFLQLTGCTVISVVDTAASAVVKTVATAVDWVIPD